MSAQSFLNQILGAVGGGPKSDTGKYATGAAAGSLLTMLVGTKRGRSMGGSVLKVGSVAALGALAYRAYGDWQRNQAQQQAQVAPPQPAWSPGGAASVTSLPAGGFAALPAPVQDVHSRAMLKALIAAAKSDGHLDEAERGRVESELQRMQSLQSDPALHGWVTAEMQRPLDPAEVAAAATSPEMAAEIYLASLVMVDTQTTMERLYLDALAHALKLPPDLRATLDARAAALV
jgi:uncharacterized membrane protein YebE (DUF533 family)